MSKRKIVRDIVIIVFLIVAAYFILRSREPGPVEKVRGQAGEGMKVEDVASVHASLPDLSQGEPVLEVDGAVIGKDWFENRVRSEVNFLRDEEGLEESEILELARELALEDGLREIVIRRTIDEWDIEADAESLEERWRALEEQAGGKEEAEILMKQVGVTRERLEERWKFEIAREKLAERVAEMNGVEPGTPEASRAYSEWMRSQILNLQVVFHDPALEELFKSMIEESGERESEAEIPPEPDLPVSTDGF